MHPTCAPISRCLIQINVSGTVTEAAITSVLRAKPMARAASNSRGLCRTFAIANGLPRPGAPIPDGEQTAGIAPKDNCAVGFSRIQFDCGCVPLNASRSHES